MFRRRHDEIVSTMAHASLRRDRQLGRELCSDQTPSIQPRRS